MGLVWKKNSQIPRSCFTPDSGVHANDMADPARSNLAIAPRSG